MRSLSAVIPVLICSVLAAVSLKAPASADRRDITRQCPESATPYVRTTLYLGLTRNSGIVSEQDWAAFLHDQVTPRFPQGLTVWTASGQWQRTDGSIGQESAKVLLLVHEDTVAGRAAVQSIVEAYKQAFQQDSVLRETAPVCAEF